MCCVKNKLSGDFEASCAFTSLESSLLQLAKVTNFRIDKTQATINLYPTFVIDTAIAILRHQYIQNPKALNILLSKIEFIWINFRMQTNNRLKKYLGLVL